MNEGKFSSSDKDWLDYLWESQIRDCTIEFNAYSERYRLLRKQISETYDKYPKLAKIMEQDEWEKGDTLSESEIKMLIEVVGAQIELSELYQRRLFFKGCRLAIRFMQCIGMLE